MRARTLAPLLAVASLPLLVAAVGCSASGSSKLAPKTDGGASGDAATDGAAGASTRPSPGTPPTSALGIVSFEATQGNDGATKLSATGIFPSSPIDLSVGQTKQLLNGYPTVPIDTCKQLAQITSSGSSSSAVDVGALSVTTPTKGTLTIGKQSFAGMTFYNQDLPLDAFVEDGAYALAATGGAGASAFSGAFYAPRRLVLTSPALGSSGTLTVPRGAPLDLSWTASPDGDPVLVTMTQENTTVVCRVTDDGAFSVPTSALASFGASSTPSAGSNPDRIAITKSTWYAIDAGGAPVVVFFDSGARLDVSFQ